MSEVTETGERRLVAGNTNETLASVDRDVAAGVPSAADLDAVAAEKAAQAATSGQAVTDTVDEDFDPLDDENTFDVSRAEFTELRDAFLRLHDRVEKYNKGASHKI